MVYDAFWICRDDATEQILLRLFFEVRGNVVAFVCHQSLIPQHGGTKLIQFVPKKPRGMACDCQPNGMDEQTSIHRVYQ